jgi:SAM-dependent methyltransferase
LKGERLFGFGATAVAAYRDRLMSKLALPSVRVSQGLRALDLGCGEGHEALALAGLGYRVEACDLEPRAAWSSNARAGRVRFFTGDAEKVKRPSNRFDLVYEKDMLHHALDPVAALREMARLAKPGGKVLVVEANLWNPVFYLHLTLMEGHRHFSRRRLTKLVHEAGLEGASIKAVEVRVWPVNRRPVQRWLGLCQDFLEGLPFLRPFLCYHLVEWHKPRTRHARPA